MLLYIYNIYLIQYQLRPNNTKKQLLFVLFEIIQSVINISDKHNFINKFHNARKLIKIKNNRGNNNNKKPHIKSTFVILQIKKSQTINFRFMKSKLFCFFFTLNYQTCNQATKKNSYIILTFSFIIVQSNDASVQRNETLRRVEHIWQTAGNWQTSRSGSI